jgi:hypothetical protein
MIECLPPNPRLQRTPSASPPSPLSRQPLARLRRVTDSIALAAISAFALGTAESAKIAIPKNLRWHQIPEIKAKVLVPTNWHFSKVDDHTWMITIEDFGATHRYDTGANLTVKHLSADQDPVAEAERIVRQASYAGGVIQPVFTEQTGAMKAFGCVVRVNAGGTDMTVAFTAIANPKTHALYTFNFQSPTEKWEASWENGKYIVGHFKLDDEI